MASDEHEGSGPDEATGTDREATGARPGAEEKGRTGGRGARRGLRGLVALAAAALSTPTVGSAAEPAGRGDAARSGQPAATGTPESEKPAAERSRGLVWKGKEAETGAAGPGDPAGERGIKIRPEGAPQRERPGQEPQAINPVMGPSRGDEGPGSPRAIQPVMGPSKGAEGPESPRAIQPVMGPSRGADAPGSPQAIQPVMGPSKQQPLEDDVVEPPEGDATKK